MRQTRTRILSLLLALVMCLGLLPVTAMAAEGEPTLFLDPNQTAPLSYNYRVSGDVGAVFPSPDDVVGEVIFHMNGAGANQTVSVKFADHKVEPPQDPILPGYRFLGWYTGTVGSDHYLYQYVSVDGYYFSGGVPDDLTFYAMWEKEAVSAYTITFNPNGGKVEPTSKQTDADGRVPGGYPTPTREGYTFLGWFTDGDGYKPAETEIWGGNQTLVARWEKTTETVRINFLPNGGRITEFKGKTVPAPNNGYPFTVDDVTGVDMHSGIGWTNTEASGLLASLPTVEREGYAFDGWYITGTGPESNLAWDGKLTDFSKLEKYTSDRKFTIGVEFAAKWVVAEGYTVTFNLNGKSGTAPKAQTVEAGKTVELPDAYANGFRLMGWGYTEDGTTLKEWKATDTVKSNLTLYALWDYDRFNFGNDYDSFDPLKSGTYAITDEYLEALKDGLSPEQWGPVESRMNSKWKGSCFGMSVLYCLRYAGRIDPGKFQANATVLYDFDAPIKSSEIFNLVNYYHLQQRRPESSGNSGYSDHEKSARNNACYYFDELVDDGSYSKCLVEDLTHYDTPSVICFSYDGILGRSAHAVAGLDCTKASDGSYSISVWNPNDNKKNDTLIISSDYKSASFLSNRYRNVKIYGSLPTATATSTFDHLNIQNYMGTGTKTSGVAMTSLDTTLSNFVLTAADGTYVEIRNGTVAGGSLKVAIGMDSAAGDAGSGYSFGLPSSSSYTLTTNADSAGNVNLSIANYYVELDSKGMKELRVTSDGQVSVSSNKAAEQILSVTSGQLGDTWNSLTITGTDTGFIVDVSKETVKIASENNVSISVTGRNVFSDAKSGTQTVTASSSGTAVAMSTLGTTSTQQPSQPTGTNPFTDVKAGAYYYDAVLWAVEQKVTSGTSATTFSPDASCTRGQIVTFLWRAAGSPKPSSNNNPFTDVKAGAYYYDAVLWAVEKGITSGTSATTFSPDTSCTRGQTVTFLYRAAGSPKAASSTNPFTDVKSGAYYYDAVLWAVEQKITSGTSATTFAPDATVTRGQTVTFLYRSQG